MSGKRIVAGLLLVAAGMYLLGERIGESAELLRLLRTWWPVLLVALGLINLARLIERPWAWAFIGPSLIIATGSLLLLYNLDKLDTQLYRELWPTVLVTLGTWVAVAGADWTGRSDSDGEVRRLVWLRGDHIAVGAGPFIRATITVLFGAVRLDLREAQLREGDPGAFVDINALFGTVEILILEGVDIEERRAFVIGRGRLRTLSIPPLGADLTVSTLGLFADVVVRPMSRWAAPHRGDEVPVSK
jgi:hypothetical protein